MNNDNQIKHHLYWIAFDLGLINQENRQEVYKRIMNNELNKETCEEIDKLVAHIKLNY